MADETKRFIIEVDSAGAVTNLNQLTDAERELDETTKGLFSSFTELNQATELLQKLGTFILGLAGNVVELADRGDRIADLAGAFESLGGSTAALEEAAERVGGLVTNTELLESANRAMLGGLPDVNKNFAEIAEAGARVAETLGIDAKQAIDQLTTGLITGREAMLRKMGVIIDTDKALADFAKANGIAVDQIDELTKKTIIQETALKQLAEQNAKAAIDTDSVGDAMVILKNEITNATDKIAIGITKNQELTKALKELAQRIKEVDWKPIIDGINQVITTAVKGAKALVDLADAIPGFKRDQAFTQAIEQVKKYDTALAQLLETARGKAQSAKTDSEVAALQENLDKVSVALETAGGWAEHWGTVALGVLSKETDSATEAFNALNDSVGDFDSGIKNAASSSGGLPKFTAEVSKAAAELQKMKDEMIAIENAKPFGSDLTVGEQQMLDILLAEEMANAAAAGKGKGFGVDILGGLFGSVDFGGDLANGIAQSVEGAIANAITVALSGGHTEDYRAVAGGLGAEIGDMIGGPIGSVVGEFLSVAVFDAFDHAFGGGRDPENNARKGVDRFFAEVFNKDRLTVIVNDQLSFIDDLDFGGSDGFEDGAGFAVFEGMADSAVSAFGSIGVAFAELLGVTEDIGAQIGAVFANNLGGDLNNLQLLIQASGASAEDLKGAIVDAFLAGELAANEAAIAIANVNEVMTDGIPGAVGAVDKAFDNLVASAGRGRAAVDAVKDIFFEAKEVGVDSFEELREHLINLGYSVEEVDKFFAALNAAGIDTFEEAISASVETIISALANLENTGFSFAEFTETAGDEIDELNDKISRIPKEIVSDYVINVRYEGEPLPTEVATYAPGAG